MILFFQDNFGDSRAFAFPYKYLYYIVTFLKKKPTRIINEIMYSL